MASDDHRNTLADSSITIPSDSERYSGPDEPSSISPPSSSASPPQMILYQKPTLWGILRGAAINLLLPFINGLMLGFGELLAHEAAFRFGLGGTKVFPSSRSAHAIGPGIEVQEDIMEKRRRDGYLDDMTSLE